MVSHSSSVYERLLISRCTGMTPDQLVCILSFRNQWSLTLVSTDYGHKGTIPAPGETLSFGWFSRWFAFRLVRVAFKVSLSVLPTQPYSNLALTHIQDSNIAGKLNQSAHLMIPNIDLFHPTVVWKVLWDTVAHPLVYYC